MNTYWRQSSKDWLVAGSRWTLTEIFNYRIRDYTQKSMTGSLEILLFYNIVFHFGKINSVKSLLMWLKELLLLKEVLQ